MTVLASLPLMVDSPALAAAQLAAQPVPRAAADHVSADAIVAALYDVISGDAGAPRDWDRFRALFHPDARMIPTGRGGPDDSARAKVITPED